jgi:hypothetical protein
MAQSEHRVRGIDKGSVRACSSGNIHILVNNFNVHISLYKKKTWTGSLKRSLDLSLMFHQFVVSIISGALSFTPKNPCPLCSARTVAWHVNLLNFPAPCAPLYDDATDHDSSSRTIAPLIWLVGETAVCAEALLSICVELELSNTWAALSYKRDDRPQGKRTGGR